jgi:polyhydroxyalkanoate synthesis regulator phasin
LSQNPREIFDLKRFFACDVEGGNDNLEGKKSIVGDMTQFESLQMWLPQILESIKREIKTEHLPRSPVFYRAHFGNRPMNRLLTEEIFRAYEKELLGGNEDLGQWVINRWVFRHGDLYNYFSVKLSELNPNFEEIKEITESQSDYILDGAVERFGAIDLYLFSLLNGVAFPPSVLERLRADAEVAKASLDQPQVKSETVEEVMARLQKEQAKWEEKYENKISGVMKKYTTDVEALKKQVRSLQQQLNACSSK